MYAALKDVARKGYPAATNTVVPTPVLATAVAFANLANLVSFADLADRPDLRVTRFVALRKRNQRKKIPAKIVITKNTKEKVAGDKD